MSLKVYNIPDELKQLKQWVAWKLVDKVGSKKPTKIPIDLATGKGAKSTDSSTWCLFTEALKGYRKHNCDGIGFVFTPPYVGIDIDGTTNLEIPELFKSYTEYSPSGKGLHIIVKGDIPSAHKKRGIEVYKNGRYFTVTGDKLDDYPKEIATANGNLKSFFSSVHTDKEVPGWIPLALDNVESGHSDKGRTPTFLRVVGRLWRDKWIETEIINFLSSYANQLEYPQEKLEKLVHDVAKRYPHEADREGPSGEHYKIGDFLKAKFNTDWVVDRIVPANSISFIAGIGGTGKSWLLIDLALSLASGKTWLDKFKLKKQHVLYIDQERPKGETQKRFGKLIGGKGLTPDEISDTLDIRIGSTIRLNLTNSYEAFDRYLTKMKPSVILIDSFVTFHTSAENSRTDMQVVFERMKELREKHNLAFIVLEHEGKAVLDPEKAKEAPNAGDMMGTSGKNQAAESVLTVRTKSETVSAVYHTKSNCGPKIEPFRFMIEDDESKTNTRIKVVGE